MVDRYFLVVSLKSQRLRGAVALSGGLAQAENGEAQLPITVPQRIHLVLSSGRQSKKLKDFSSAALSRGRSSLSLRRSLSRMLPLKGTEAA